MPQKRVPGKMNVVTSKKEIKALCEKTFASFSAAQINLFAEELHGNFLTKKIRFPLLEYGTKEIFAKIPAEFHFKICDKIIEQDTIGGNVVIGIVLQLHLKEQLNYCIEKACQYIQRANEWYACDIIAERVMGYALLTQPEKTTEVLKKLARHNSNWVVRTVGVATHLAVKWGLKKNYVEEMFLLLLSLAGSTDFHIKTGTGWGAKTCVKFYPELAEKHAVKINEERVRPWFRSKLKIGLGRSEKYKDKFAVNTS